ncbi:MAG: glycine--tRNA ligase [Phycisphaerales bacterium]
MSNTAATSTPAVDNSLKSMDELVALCKRRGFVFPASEIYGGINGFWDYGPLGTQLKNNLRDMWWRDMVECPPDGPDGHPLEIVGLDSSIVQNPRVWEASGHVGGFNDPMVDCRDTKHRYRADHLQCLCVDGDQEGNIYVFVADDEQSKAAAIKKLEKEKKQSLDEASLCFCAFADLSVEEIALAVGPDTKKRGTLTEPRQFNLMFPTYVGAVFDEENKAYLRPETAQGIFINYKNVLDTTRVRVPFGIAQVGKSFRNEVTPRNFIFRSREFEQMEMEWFCHPDEAGMWYEYWVTQRLEWWRSIGLTSSNLQRREHDDDELAHYSTACADIEYKYPFTAPEFGELEGIAHRGNFDLTQHQTHARTKLEYFDQERNERYLPHVIEPAAGLTRGMLALLCEAFTPDDSRPSKMFLRFDPRLAPVQAALFPLVNKDGMPELGERLYRELRTKYRVQYDAKQNIGKRYARMDEIGTPFCFTIDGESLTDQTVTVRHRDSLQQDRLNISQVAEFLAEHVGT